MQVFHLIYAQLKCAVTLHCGKLKSTFKFNNEFIHFSAKIVVFLLYEHIASKSVYTKDFLYWPTA